MRMIRPIAITAPMLTASNVPEDDAAAWSISTAYVVGNLVVSNHVVYECLVNNTGFIPDSNSSGTSPKWLNLGATNRWKMFDDRVGSQTSRADNITVTVAPGVVFDSIAFLDVEASEIEVTMTDPVEGVVYQESIDLVMQSAVVDGYTYFFEPIITSDTVVLLGIPPYSSASISISINYPGGTSKVGTMVIGTQKLLGGTKMNPEVGITDYSRKEVDTFGNYSVIQRAYSKRLSCELILDSNTVDDVSRTLAEHRTTPVVWVGAEKDYSSMIVYGFYRNFSIIISDRIKSICTLQIEGLT